MRNMVRMVWLDFGVCGLRTIGICPRCRIQSMSVVAVAVAVAVDVVRLVFGRLYVGLWQIVAVVAVDAVDVVAASVAIVLNQLFVPILVQPHLELMYLKNPFFHPYAQCSLPSRTKLTSIAQFSLQVSVASSLSLFPVRSSWFDCCSIYCWRVIPLHRHS